MAEQMSAAEFRNLISKGRKVSGRRARENGISSETIVLDICSEYLKQGRAKLEKVDPPSKVVGTGKARRIVYLTNPFLDLVGTWTENGGRALFLEVKSTEGRRLSISRSGGITEKQLTHLREWRDAGAIVGVLWIHDGDLKVISLETIEFAEASGNASIPWGEFPSCRRGKSPFLRFDFLSELKTNEKVS